jgi:hypothetical protein
MFITAVGRHWGPVIPTSAKKPRSGEIRQILTNDPKGLLGAWIIGNPRTTKVLINQSSCTGEHRWR